jgi:hypothetical protein
MDRPFDDVVAGATVERSISDDSIVPLFAEHLGVGADRTADHIVAGATQHV